MSFGVLIQEEAYVACLMAIVRLEALKRDRAGQHSIRIDDQFH